MTIITCACGNSNAVTYYKNSKNKRVGLCQTCLSNIQDKINPKINFMIDDIEYLREGD